MLTRFKRQQCQKNFHYSQARKIPITYPAYEPASWQAEAFHKSEKHIKFLFGGDRAAKTGTVGYELVCLTRRFPGQLFWAAALTEEKLQAVWKWHKHWLSPREIKYINWRITEQIPRFVLLQNGGKIEYKTWKSGPGSFSADSVKGIQLDEDGARVSSVAEQTYNDCLSRIIDCDGYILGGATPVLGKNWMYYRIFLYNRGEREDKTPDPDIDRWNVSLLDNKFISDEQKQKAKGRMAKDEIDRRFYGLFTTLQGAVFKEWNEDRHVKDFGLLPFDTRKAVGIDLGARHPFCALFGGYYDEKIWIWDEYYEDEKGSVTSEEHARDMQEYESNRGYFQEGPGQPLYYEDRLCDHDLQERIDLESFGYWTSPANKDRQLSWLVMNRLMKENRLIIHERCYELIRTIPLYHYKEQRPGTDQKEDAVKEDDDPIDALRYLTMYFCDGSDWDPSMIQGD